ncbi:hypothetical protein WJX74_003888 [Apatococcus lobatus]|uniref:AMP-dependent synthetase/ligase domain-containing protein n=1 Tax=Apatococcus lobatus TaxID=904363 RepID=A0AAW1RVE7_9CHLO
MTYQETKDKVTGIASALLNQGIKPHDRIGIYSPNCPEWMITAQACNRVSAVCVPLYDSLGEGSVEYIAHHAHLKVIFASASKMMLLKKSLPKLKGYTKVIVYFGEVDESSPKAVSDQGIKLVEFDDFMQQGFQKPGEAVPPKPMDLACIQYTSGTTGKPKGVMLTHAAMVSEVASITTFLQEGEIACGEGDSILSYLTLAHILGRVVEDFLLSAGGCIGYWQGDVKKIMEDAEALRPTFFVAVPRVLERLMGGIKTKVAKQGWLTQILFRWGFHQKLTAIHQGKPLAEASPFWDANMFRRFQDKLGGKVRFIISGGAPLALKVEEFLMTVLCCPVLQGYGLTESCAASFLALPRKGHAGTVGPPVPGTEFCLKGDEEMGYDPNGDPPRGEICIRGPILFSGYYKEKELTADAIDEDGFFHTGDVGELTPYGCLKIIDRLKNMFKLAQGEYVAAEKLESLFRTCRLIDAIWVYGNSYETCLVAVVRPEKAALQEWAESENIEGELSAICEHPKVGEHLVEELERAGKQQQLQGYEMIKAVHVTLEDWNEANDLMTPSMKLKRSKLQQHYKPQLDALYAGAPVSSKTSGPVPVPSKASAYQRQAPTKKRKKPALSPTVFKPPRASREEMPVLLSEKEELATALVQTGAFFVVLNLLASCTR